MARTNRWWRYGVPTVPEIDVTVAERHGRPERPCRSDRTARGAGGVWRGAPIPAAMLLVAALAPAGGCAVFEAAGIDPRGPQPLAGAARSAMHGRGNVQVTLEPDGTALVTGWVEDALSEQAVLDEVASYPGVTGVIDHLTVEY